MIKINLSEELSRIKSIMYIDEQVRHIYQPTGHSCGPTCIKMVGDFLVGNVGKIDNICKMCGTDYVVGTPPDRMKLGLDKLKLKYIEHQKEIEPFQSIRNTIDKGNVAIVRTVTQGVPHWIVIDAYDKDGSFGINDPWLGPIRYTEEELDRIWRIRDFFYFEMIGNNVRQPEGKVEIRRIEKADEEVIVPNLARIFSRTGLSNEQVWDLIEYDPNLSVVATVNGKVGGFYFLGDGQIPPGGPEYEKLKEMKGIEGIALGVLPEFKNMGIGKKLMEYSQNIGADYIWGYQFKSLKNIDDWLKRRKIYWEDKDLYLTYQILKKS
jgi:GNAT superfamily N-acetyltransferase